MPIWAYLNAQFTVSRTGGDVLMGAVTDGFVNKAPAKLVEEEKAKKEKFEEILKTIEETHLQ